MRWFELKKAITVDVLHAKNLSRKNGLKLFRMRNNVFNVKHVHKNNLGL